MIKSSSRLFFEDMLQHLKVVLNNLKSSCTVTILIKTKKPAWVINKEKLAREQIPGRVWIFGIHAVKEALKNSHRRKHSLILTPNAHKKLVNLLVDIDFEPEIVDSRNFSPPLEYNSVHQGVALETSLLNWGSLSEICAPKGKNKLVLLLDRVTDPQNVGAILRSAQFFEATAVIAPRRYSCPETGSLAKSASGSLDRQPYLRVPNLARAMTALKEMGYFCLGLETNSDVEIEESFKSMRESSIALVVGSEALGIRELTRKNCDITAKIGTAPASESLNVSNAAALALFLANRQLKLWASNKRT